MSSLWRRATANPGRFLVNALLWLPRSLRARLLSPAYMIQRCALSLLHARDLACVQDNTARIRAGDVLLFATLRNEAPRIPWFLEYYRGLGVAHFCFVDNGSDDDFMDRVRTAPDVSVWHTQASYRDANFGMHWLNHLLRRYGSGHWCVTCDPDEFLVYPHCGERNLAELGAFLEGEERLSLGCVMLDMYSDRPVADTHYAAGDDPVATAPFFDGCGYVQEQGWLRETKIAGGVRRRMFFREFPDKAPAIHKTPFVKWRWTYSYFLSMHQLVPEGLNMAHTGGHVCTTGCLLHFKYFALMEDKVAEEIERKQHWDDSFEYRQYNAHLGTEHRALHGDNSIRFEGWRQLVDDGFMNVGQWF